MKCLKLYLKQSPMSGQCIAGGTAEKGLRVLHVPASPGGHCSWPGCGWPQMATGLAIAWTNKLNSNVRPRRGVPEDTEYPGWCGSVDRAPKCRRFNSQSGPMPGLQARSPVGGA